MRDQDSIDSPKNNSPSTDETDFARIRKLNAAYPNPQSVGAGQLNDASDENNAAGSKDIISKVVLAGIGLFGLLVVFWIGSIYWEDAQGQKKYEEAKQRCGHEPIIYMREDRGIRFAAPNPRLELGPAIAPGSNDDYYCTLSEAQAAGHTQGEIDIIRRRIEYDMSPGERSQYQ